MEDHCVCTQNKRAGWPHRNSTTPAVSLPGTQADGHGRKVELLGAVQCHQLPPLTGILYGLAGQTLQAKFSTCLPV